MVERFNESDCWFVIDGDVVARLRALRERLNNGTRLTYDERRAWASVLDRVLDCGAWMRWEVPVVTPAPEPGTVVLADAVGPASEYVIRATNPADVDEETGAPLYWSNADGWVDRASADTFSAAETGELNLPIGGAWEKVQTALLAEPNNEEA